MHNSGTLGLRENRRQASNRIERQAFKRAAQRCKNTGTMHLPACGLESSTFTRSLHQTVSIDQQSCAESTGQLTTSNVNELQIKRWLQGVTLQPACLEQKCLRPLGK